MHKKSANKKVLLNRETLCQLSTDRLEAVAGGATGYSICYTCGSVCRTNCHSC
jgi:hypothetical protein